MGVFRKLFSIEEEEQEEPEIKEPAPEENRNDDEEVRAAIATALYLVRQDIHDYENYVLKIKRIDKVYSPWSSKIYSLRRSPR